MSVYNGETWLEESIQSILNQSLTAIEFIIINDGSQDRSLEIINRYALLDNRIVVINKSNSGLADSLNQGIILARGEWIARIDADDISEPNRLQKQYELAQSDTDLILIGSNKIQIDRYGRPIAYFTYPLSHNRILRNILYKKKFFPHSSAFYRTSTVKQIGGYRTRIKRAQDLDLWLRLSELGKLGCIGQPLVKIRSHLGQISYEEQGRRQIINSRVAIISYWLRKKGCFDPVAADCSDEDFHLFETWVTNRLEQNRIFDYFKFINNIKKTTIYDGLSLASYLWLLFSQPVFNFRYLSYNLLGETFLKKLARVWQKQHHLRNI